MRYSLLTGTNSQDYTEHHTDTKVHFVITLTEESANWDDKEIEKNMKLSKFISMNNMHLFDPSGHIRRYDSPSAILEEFYNLRLDFYDKRKVFVVACVLLSPICELKH